MRGARPDMARVRIRDPLRLRFLDWVRRWPQALRRRMEIGAIAVLGLVVLIVAFRQPMSDRIYPEARTQQMLDAAARALQARQADLARRHRRARVVRGRRWRWIRIATKRAPVCSAWAKPRLREAAQGDRTRGASRKRTSRCGSRANSRCRARRSMRIDERLRQHEVESRRPSIRCSRDAAAARQAGHLDGDPKAALPLYKAVLSLQPSNNTALEGREDALSRPAAAGAGASDARRVRGRRRARRARARIRPGPRRLARCAGRAHAGARQANARARDTALRGKQLDAATDAYRAALALDPDDDASARQPRRALAAAWAQRSQRAASDFDFDEAERALDLRAH